MPPVISSGVVFLLHLISSLLFFQDEKKIDLFLPKRWTHDNFTQPITPIPCHSHNDYYRPYPLYSALSHGCTSIEADVFAFNDELYVGHNTHALTTMKTFRAMYIQPLVALLDERNANISTTPSNPSEERSIQHGLFIPSNQSLTLLIDFKSHGPTIYALLHSSLAPLRERGYLTTYNGTDLLPGPITVVATGTAPFSLIATSHPTSRDIFYDAPLHLLTFPSPDQDDIAPSQHQYNTTTSALASSNFRRTIGHLYLPWRYSVFHASDIALIRSMIHAAHARGLKVRFWGTPSWPRSLRDRVWERLVEEGVDVLNGDDLGGMAAVVGKAE